LVADPSDQGTLRYKKEFLNIKAKPIPDGYHSVTPYLIVKGAAAAIDFYKLAFGATELMRLPGPDGKVGHAEIRIGDSPVMLADEHPEVGAVSPQTLGGSPVHMLIYVEDVDARFAQAIAAGAKELRPVKDQFYGDRSGTLKDPFGHMWTIATHTEDVTHEEMQKRMEALKH
jgi:PhnB protein